MFCSDLISAKDPSRALSAKASRTISQRLLGNSGSIRNINTGSPKHFHGSGKSPKHGGTARKMATRWNSNNNFNNNNNSGHNITADSLLIDNYEINECELINNEKIMSEESYKDSLIEEAI